MAADIVDEAPDEASFSAGCMIIVIELFLS